MFGVDDDLIIVCEWEESVRATITSAAAQFDRRIHSAEHVFSLGYIMDLLVDRPLFILFLNK